MKVFLHVFSISALAAIISSTSFVRAQDGPPPADAQYAPPPPSDDQNAMGGPNQYAPPDQGPPPDQSAPPDQGGDQGASFQTFYDQLGSQGNWVQTDDYGYVFQPNVTDPNWAPYTDGHWVYADVGWTWVSDEPWGWATYHYGRWANIDGTGWVWVPGYRWAPAWVSWRYGGGYCGWAPLPPETFIGAEYAEPGLAIGIGFHFGGDVDVNFHIGPGCYNFVPVGYMGARNYHGYYLDRGRNYTVINNTTNITNINVNKTVVNNYYGANGANGNFRGVTAGGPPINEVNAHSQQHVQTVRLAAANQPGRANLQGNSLAVYAPHVNAATARQARPAQVTQTIAHPTFNRGDSISRPLAVNSTVRPNAPTAEQVQAAQEARDHAPARAKIATEGSPVKTFNRPLTSMQPVVQTARTQSVTPGANVVHPSAQPSAAGAPYTGESANHNAQHTTVNPAYTGEPNHTAVNPQPNVVHPSATSPYTGEPEKPATTYHPQTEVAPAQTYHPQSETPQVPSHHEQVQTPPTQVYHPQAETPQVPSHHESEISPAPSYHPQAQTAPTHPSGAPVPQVHAQAPAGGGQPHAQAAPGNHPAASGEKKDNGNGH